MKINKLGFLSLLVLLGILGLIVDRPLSGFFGFSYYLRYFFVRPDEMFQQNVRRAASIGLFSGAAATGLAIATNILLPAFLSVNVALASCFVVSMFCFTVALIVLEIKEQREC